MPVCVCCGLDLIPGVTLAPEDKPEDWIMCSHCQWPGHYCQSCGACRDHHEHCPLFGTATVKFAVPWLD